MTPQPPQAIKQSNNKLFYPNPKDFKQPILGNNPHIDISRCLTGSTESVKQKVPFYHHIEKATSSIKTPVSQKKEAVSIVDIASSVKFYIDK